MQLAPDYRPAPQAAQGPEYSDNPARPAPPSTMHPHQPLTITGIPGTLQESPPPYRPDVFLLGSDPQGTLDALWQNLGPDAWLLHRPAEWQAQEQQDMVIEVVGLGQDSAAAIVLLLG